MLHKGAVSPELLKLPERLFAQRQLDDFVLVGGTALSLRIGHRRSIDIDLFIIEEFPAESLLDFLKEHSFDFRRQSRFKGGMLGHIDNIKVDFIRHAYPG